MHESPKHKASKANCTTAVQSMKDMAKATQNSPRTCQNDTKTCMEGSQNKLAWRALGMIHTRQIRWITLHLLRPSMEWLKKQKSELYHGKIPPNKHWNDGSQAKAWRHSQWLMLSHKVANPPTHWMSDKCKCMSMKHGLKSHNKWCQIIQIVQVKHASGLGTQS